MQNRLYGVGIMKTRENPPPNARSPAAAKPFNKPADGSNPDANPARVRRTRVKK
jgi:hypothetical protein